MSAHEVIDVEPKALIVRERSAVVLTPVMDVNTAKARLQEFQEFCAHYLQESKDGGNDGGDYGVIPGTKKKTLLKSGADKLCELYGLYDKYEVKATIDWETGLFDYELTCILKSRRDDSEVGSGVGSCSSFESKYKWREQKRQCPSCGKETIIKGKAEYGGGWLCWKKEGKSDGCGAKFKDGDKSIEDQVQGRVENPDIVDIKNTVLKMAKKRAKIDAVISVTRSSGIFTQDMDDIPMPPAKPSVPVTDRDIPLEGSAVQPSAGAASGPAQTSKPDEQPENYFEKVKKQVTAPDYPSEVVGNDGGMKINFRQAWFKACPAGMPEDQKEIERKAWLQKNGFVWKGVPTSSMIPKAVFEDSKKLAVKFAKAIKWEVPF